jgi:hypothetical protein
MNASNSPWTPELQATVRRLFAKHKTATEIGRQVGMSKNQIAGWLDRQGLKRREPNPYRLTRREQARERECTARCDYDGPTTLDRLQAYRDKMDAALAECKSIPRIPPVNGTLYKLVRVR